MSLLELLAKGAVDEFNDSRGVRTRVDLFAADLPGLALVGIDLSGANVAKADLTGSDLTDANLFKVDMVGIDGTGMKLVGAIAHRARLRDAYLDAADLTDADFTKGDLSEAVLTGARGERVRLCGARLKEIDAHEVVWTEADLSEAQLHKADLEGADLRRADLTEATGGEARFVNARLDGVVAVRARLQGADFTGASLVGARLEGANLAGADLSNADLTSADLTKANLTGATLTGAVLRGASLANACLDDVDLTGVDLAEADLTGLDPATLGLTSEQTDAVAAIGAAVDVEAPLSFGKVSVAYDGERAAVLWVNADDEETSSIRWAILREGEPPVSRPLPLTPEGVLARWVAPVGDGFDLLLLQERAGTLAVVRYPLSADGEVGAAKTYPLGYAPAVVPSVRVDGDVITLRGLARRGPTVVVHKLSDDTLEPVYSGRVATASGVLGRYAPVLVCKGGVVMTLGDSGVGAPLRTPDAFPGRVATAAPFDDTAMVVWVEAERGEDRPGGLRFSVLPRRGAPEPRVLTADDRVISLDSLPTADGVWLAWVQGDPDEGFVVGRAQLPDGLPEVVPVPDDVFPQEIRFAQRDQGVPVVAITTMDERLLIVDLDGRLIGRMGG